MFYDAGTADGRFLKSVGFISHVYLEKSPESVFGNERPIKKKLQENWTNRLFVTF